MFVNFENLGDEARIWIYQADRKLNNNEVEALKSETRDFIERWTAHGQNLRGSFKIIYDRFLVLGVDEDIAQASGCSIDSSVTYIKNLEKKFNINFLDRSKVALLLGEMIVLEDFNELKAKIKGREIKPETITFNNSITRKSELESGWKSNIENSWLKKYI